MEMWTEIRRKVLVEGASKRSIRRDDRISAEALEKILAHPEPPGYRQSVPRRKLKLGKFLPVIDGILEADQTAPPKSATRPSASMSGCATNTATRGAPPR
jgi:hypothetical protein